MDKIIELSRRKPKHWPRSESARKWQKQRDRKRRKYARWNRIEADLIRKRDKFCDRERLKELGLIWNLSPLYKPPTLYIDWPLVKKEGVPETYLDYPEDIATIDRTSRHYQHIRRLLRNRVV